jgi:hypothetical protein
VAWTPAAAWPSLDAVQRNAELLAPARRSPLRGHSSGPQARRRRKPQSRSWRACLSGRSNATETSPDRTRHTPTLSGIPPPVRPLPSLPARLILRPQNRPKRPRSQSRLCHSPRPTPEGRHQAIGGQIRGQKIGDLHHRVDWRGANQPNVTLGIAPTRRWSGLPTTDRRTPPNRLEALKGDRAGQHPREQPMARVLLLKDGDAYDVEVTDYH